MKCVLGSALRNQTKQTKQTKQRAQLMNRMGDDGVHFWIKAWELVVLHAFQKHVVSSWTYSTSQHNYWDLETH